MAVWYFDDKLGLVHFRRIVEFDFDFNKLPIIFKNGMYQIQHEVASLTVLLFDNARNTLKFVQDNSWYGLYQTDE